MDNNRDHLFDVRIVERNITRGVVSREEYERWLESQEDAAELAENSSTHFVHTRHMEIGGHGADELAEEDDQG